MGFQRTRVQITLSTILFKTFNFSLTLSFFSKKQGFLTKIGFFEKLFLCYFVFTILLPEGPLNTNLVRNCIFWNIPFCASHVEELPETRSCFETHRICNTLFSKKKRTSSFSSSSQSKTFYFYKSKPNNNLRFCSMRQNPDVMVSWESAIFWTKTR